MTFGLDHRPFADFDDEVRIADISALHDLVTSPVAERGLHAWAGDSLSRAALLSEVAFVLIRWSKTLGQPRTPTLAAAFTVKPRVPGREVFHGSFFPQVPGE